MFYVGTEAVTEAAAVERGGALGFQWPDPLDDRFGSLGQEGLQPRSLTFVEHGDREPVRIISGDEAEPQEMIDEVVCGVLLGLVFRGKLLQA